MRKILYPAVFSMIVVAGLFIGMVKGQEVRHKWIARMKAKHAEQKENESWSVPERVEVTLDEIEMATYHS